MTDPARLALGLMSGTSLDGIDVALVEVQGRGESMTPNLVAFDDTPYPEAIADALRRSLDLDLPTLARLHWDVGRAFADAARHLVERSGHDPGQITVIGSHGQTVYHEARRSTLQIGEAAVIREKTGIPTVADFRPADIAAGGEGAPLVPWVDWLLYRSPGRTRLAQNIGGIGNVTRVRSERSDIIAFDTGPGNLLIDQMMRVLTDGKREWDEGGKLAASGTPDREIVARWLEAPFFRQPPPRSTGRELFGEPFFRRALDDTTNRTDADRLATVTYLTAASIAAAYHDFIGSYDEVILSGGGARNETLVGYLRDLLQPIPVVTSDQYGLPVDAKEAVAFAMLGLAALDGVPANIPGATGANREVVLGKIHP